MLTKALKPEELLMNPFEKPLGKSEIVVIGLVFAVVAFGGYQRQRHDAHKLANTDCQELRQDMPWHTLPNRCLTRAEYEHLARARGTYIRPFSFTVPGLF